MGVNRKRSQGAHKPKSFYKIMDSKIIFKRQSNCTGMERV